MVLYAGKKKSFSGSSVEWSFKGIQKFHFMSFYVPLLHPRKTTFFFFWSTVVFFILSAYPVYLDFFLLVILEMLSDAFRQISGDEIKVWHLVPEHTP